MNACLPVRLRQRSGEEHVTNLKQRTLRADEAFDADNPPACLAPAPSLPASMLGREETELRSSSAPVKATRRFRWDRRWWWRQRCDGDVDVCGSDVMDIFRKLWLWRHGYGDSPHGSGFASVVATQGYCGEVTASSETQEQIVSPRPLPLRRRFPLAPVSRPPHHLPLGLRGWGHGNMGDDVIEISRKCAVVSNPDVRPPGGTPTFGSKGLNFLKGWPAFRRPIHLPFSHLSFLCTHQATPCHTREQRSGPGWCPVPRPQDTWRTVPGAEAWDGSRCPAETAAQSLQALTSYGWARAECSGTGRWLFVPQTERGQQDWQMRLAFHIRWCPKFAVLVLSDHVGLALSIRGSVLPRVVLAPSSGQPCVRHSCGFGLFRHADGSKRYNWATTLVVSISKHSRLGKVLPGATQSLVKPKITRLYPTEQVTRKPFASISRSALHMTRRPCGSMGAVEQGQSSKPITLTPARAQCSRCDSHQEAPNPTPSLFRGVMKLCIAYARTCVIMWIALLLINAFGQAKQRGVECCLWYWYCSYYAGPSTATRSRGSDLVRSQLYWAQLGVSCAYAPIPPPPPPSPNSSLLGSWRQRSHRELVLLAWGGQLKAEAGPPLVNLWLVWWQKRERNNGRIP